MNNDKQLQTQAQTMMTSAPMSYFPTEQDWKMILEIGKHCYESGMLPAAIKNPIAASIIVLKAREIGIAPMIGFAHIHVINGKPTLSAELMQALARRNLPGLLINIIESTKTQATIEFQRPEPGAKPYRSIFTIDDAKAADLLKKDVWRQYPAAMLFSRAISAGLRKICPEALMGIGYTPEELGANVDESGNVVETTSREVNDDEAALIEMYGKMRRELTELIRTSKIFPSVVGKFARDNINPNLKSIKELADEDLPVVLDFVHKEIARQAQEKEGREPKPAQESGNGKSDATTFEDHVNKTPDPREYVK